MRKGLLITVLFLVLAYIGLGYYFSNLIIATPPRRTTEVSHSELMKGWGYDQAALEAGLSTPREVEFPSVTDGLMLRGSLYEGADSVDCGIVMAHGITENRANMFKYASIFEDCGCDMLLYDHRGHGKSDGDQLTGGNYEGKDVLEAVKFLSKEKGLSPKQIGLIGESWGAAAVLIAASQNDELAFVLAESSYSSWGDAIQYRANKQFGSWISVFLPIAYTLVELRADTDMDGASPKDAASEIKIPTLLVHSSTDTITPPNHSITIAKELDPQWGKATILEWNVWHAHNALERPAAYKEMVISHFGGYGVQLCE
ncbi:MAG: alpha/beta hydrolase [Saprospiraceae bacterium]